MDSFGDRGLMSAKTHYDVIVIGGGHAGCEAAAVAARMGATTGLFTHSFDTIGALSCNPAVGGLGKGHLVREVDALDGLIGCIADEAGIHFRVLNRSKGPAVRGPRAQVDRQLYKSAMQKMLKGTPGLSIVPAEVSRLGWNQGKVSHVVTAEGDRFDCGSVVVTTGTFLRGIIHLGDVRTSAGRVGEAACETLSASFQELGLRLARLKTGTPARLDGRTINWDILESQPGDSQPEPFCSIATTFPQNKVHCHITRTTDQTHEIIRQNIHRSAVYSGQITGRGPRYCPSIEDKVVRFADRESHQVFLEPEGIDDPTIYPNGLSTSLPADVQARFLRTLPGLEKVELFRPGYAIEYDHVDPTELDASLQVKKLEGLFLAGQINGTTGYEEAAAQGIVAGLNAARRVAGLSPIIFDRSQAYLGVMIDDLITRGVTEPYRMFTSRAEYRLSLRVDNADQRLTQIGIDAGCVGLERSRRFSEKMNSLQSTKAMMENMSITPSEALSHGLQVNRDGVSRSAFSLLSYPEINWQKLCTVWPELRQVDERIAQQISNDARYHVYLHRQTADIAAFRADEGRVIAPDVDYDAISGLSSEIRNRLKLVQPVTLGQAGRIEGMTPAGLATLLAHIKSQSNNRDASKLGGKFA